MAKVLQPTHIKTRHHFTALALLAGSLITVTPAAEAASQRYALLIGIGTYADTQLPKLELKGPPNDVQAMQSALKAWGFHQITVLQDAQATRAAIFNALDEMIKKAEPGSHVLFYFSGHGTSPSDYQGIGASLALPHTTGALVPYDAQRQGDAQATRKSLIIGHEDLRPRFEKLDKKGIYVTAWVDACFSEHATRSMDGFTSRAAPGFKVGGFGTGSAGSESYPYQNAITFAASGATQTATDIDGRVIRQFPTFDQQPHGAFSDALLRALNDRQLPGYGPLDKNGDGVVSVDEFATGVTSFMGSRAYAHQPKLQPLSNEDSKGARNQPLFVVAQPSPATAPVAPAQAKPEPTPLVASNLPEPQRRQQLLDRILHTAQQSGQATVGLELQHPYASNRLPIGDATHCIKVELSYKADQPGYPLVIDRFSDGTVQWLYPLAGADARRQQNQWQQPIPAGQAQKLWATKTTPPPGVDTLYTFLLDQPLAPDVITSTDTIKPTDGARFDLLVDALEKVRVLGAHRLALDIYEPQPGELKNWPEETCL